MEIDHIFAFIDPTGPQAGRLAAAGFRETYRRKHPGQGTANVCYALENLFIELIWLTSAVEAGSEAIRRTGLLERSRWRETGACPFGIAWRAASIDTERKIQCWPFRPVYLPEEISIAVATDSDDFRQPMMFSFPGSTAPSEWSRERQNELQRTAGFSRVSRIEFSAPAAMPTSSCLSLIADEVELLELIPDAPAYLCRLTLLDLEGREAGVLELPDCVFHPAGGR